MTAATPATTAGRDRATATRLTTALGAAALVGLVVHLVLALGTTPADRVQRDAVRLLYVHVPAAWLAYLAFAVTALGSALYLWRRTRARFWDVAAGAAAELGVLFTALTLALGSIWGRATWGVFWTWDARLTTTALLLVLYLGYLALRRVPADPEVRARRSAIAALVAFVDVPLVHLSVEWWRTLHQEPTFLRRDLDPTIDTSMAVGLWVSVLAYTLVFAWLLVHRFRVAWLEDRLDDHALEAALAERRAEAEVDPELVVSS